MPQARVAFAFAAGIIGISFAAIFVRFALPATPVITGFYRMLFATIGLGAYLAMRSRGSGAWANPPPGLRTGVTICLASGVFFAFDLGLWQTATTETSVANATLLVNTTPIYVGVMSFALLGQRLSRAFFVGAGLAIVGCALLVGVELDQPRALAGDLKAAAAAVFYSVYLMGMKSARETVDATWAVFYAGVSATLVFAAMGLVLGHDFAGFPARSWGAIICAALFSQLGGALLIAWALRYLRATFASVGLIGQSICAAALGWILLGEAVTLLQTAGAGVLLLGIWIASRDAVVPHAGDV
jgi:drug/metabolite transporter (DMT)-like permease